MIASLGFLPGAPLTRDQWIMLQKDNVPSGKHPGFKAFGITPTPMSAVAPGMAEPVPQGRPLRAATPRR